MEANEHIFILNWAKYAGGMDPIHTCVKIFSLVPAPFGGIALGLLVFIKRVELTVVYNSLRFRKWKFLLIKLLTNQ